MIRGVLSAAINPKSYKGGGDQIDPPVFLALNFCSLTDYEKLWYNCFFVR